MRSVDWPSELDAQRVLALERNRVGDPCFVDLGHVWELRLQLLDEFAHFSIAINRYVFFQ